MSQDQENRPPSERDSGGNARRQAKSPADSGDLDALLRRTHESVRNDFEEIRRDLEQEKARIVGLLEALDREDEALAARPGRQLDPRSEAVAEAPELAPDLTAPPDTDRPRSLRQRVYGIVATTLATVGVVLLTEAGITLLWQEPFSHAYTSWQQGKLNDQLDEVEASLFRVPSPRGNGLREPPQPSLADQAKTLAEKTDAEDPLGRLRIPGLDVEQVLVEGVDPGSLARGPGHYQDTSLPGQHGTVGVAGHRTTYSAPFRDIDQLAEGQAIRVEMPYGRFAYRVTGSAVVPPDQISVLGRVDHDRLVLTSCHPAFSDAERIVVFARLTRSTRKPLKKRPDTAD